MEQNYKGLLKGINFLSFSRIALLLFAALVVLGSVAYTSRGGFTMGTDFSGGIRIEFTAPAEVGDLRALITVPGVSITTLNTEGIKSFLLTAPVEDQGEGILEAYLQPIQEKYDSENVTVISSSFVGPNVGYDFSLQALRLVAIVSLLILFYVAFRFDYMYGVGAIVSSLHDIVIMAVITLMLGIPVDLTVLAAFLTILGYSINDTIVIFDRIRENHASLPEEDLAPIMNKSISQCLVRTLLTSVTTLFVAVSIYIWAGSALKNFGLMMIVGVLAGTYSSIFIAAPVTHALWKMRRQKINKKAVRL